MTNERLSVVTAMANSIMVRAVSCAGGSVTNKNATRESADAAPMTKVLMARRPGQALSSALDGMGTFWGWAPELNGQVMGARLSLGACC